MSLLIRTLISHVLTNYLLLEFSRMTNDRKHENYSTLTFVTRGMLHLYHENSHGKEEKKLIESHDCVISFGETGLI